MALVVSFFKTGYYFSENPVQSYESDPYYDCGSFTIQQLQ